MLSGVGSHAINAGIYKKMPIDPVKDFTHISLIASGAKGAIEEFMAQLGRKIEE